MEQKEQQIIELITSNYLNSAQFNGTSYSSLKDKYSQDVNEVSKIVRRFIQDGKISANFGDRHPNPAILAFDPESIDIQLEKFSGSDLQRPWFYPTQSYLKGTINEEEYGGRPFTLKLAQGESQLSYYSFDPTVLETYRNDPRYHFHYDFHGSIIIREEFYKEGKIPEEDQISLETFGFSYDKDKNRSIAVFLRYLNMLSPKHQRLWFEKKLEGTFYLHPDYLASLMGEWSMGISIFHAFLWEQRVINSFCSQINKPNLFRRVWDESNRPPEFGFLIRPTLKELSEFYHTVDKMLSENIEPNFFKGDLDTDHEETDEQGRIRITQKGSLQLLEEWLRKKYKLHDPDSIRLLLSPWRKIRRLRQPKAHTISNDKFDRDYLKQQEEIFEEVFQSLRTLRLIFSKHPLISNLEEANELDKLTVWIN